MTNATLIKIYFYICEFDCNEKIQKYQFENEHIAFLIKGSTRFRSKNRLILYRINKNEMLEDTGKHYKYFNTLEEIKDFIENIEVA